MLYYRVFVFYTNLKYLGFDEKTLQLITMARSLCFSSKKKRRKRIKKRKQMEKIRNYDEKKLIWLNWLVDLD